MLTGFKNFLLRGNVVDLAVAVVVGTAFTAVVTAFTESFLEPLIAVFTGGAQMGGRFFVRGVAFDYGGFLNAVVTFLITAAVVYFLVVLPLKKISQRRAQGEEAGPAPSADVELLTEIRDLLARQDAARRASAHEGPSAPEPRGESPSS